MVEVCQLAVDNGATTLNIPDTVGFAVPEDYGKLIAYVIANVRGDFVVSTHCHDDLGLAVANSLAGVANGARQVECAINGLGERAGNAALEEVVMAIRTRSDYFAGVGVGVKSDELARTSRLVSRLTGYHVQYNKAVVGRNAFAHEAGIHQHGVLADRETYEVIDASQVGQEAAQIVLGKHSGRHAFADTLEKMGIHVQGDALNAAFVRFKELADKKIEITEADLEAIVAEELGTGMVHRFSVYELEVHGGTATQAERAGRARSRRRQGRGDRQRRRHDRRRDRRDLRSDRRVRQRSATSRCRRSPAVPTRSARSRSRSTPTGRKVTGRGVATDVVEASARAYLNAVNKLVRLRERGEVREITGGP